MAQASEPVFFCFSSAGCSGMALRVPRVWRFAMPREGPRRDTDVKRAIMRFHAPASCHGEAVV
ncbi:MAG: hypothetical protein KF859_01890, partial [Phycisphaeraceae bacterium]|nr:hypothetical protein [Phycisphaeraceae bacterium]